ncbi:MAG: N-acetylmuramic acid 6-phosphate etherase [Phycisphaerae bacterium]
MEDRGHLTTELPNPHSKHLDALSVGEAFALINREDASVAVAVERAKGDICRTIESVVGAFSSGGRLIYVGAGTSGRLGVLDAAECPPTFLSEPHQVQGIIAGGREAMFRSVEGAEDSREAGASAIEAVAASGQAVGANDVVFGIATGGTTPFVHGAMARAKQLGAKTVFFACVEKGQVTDEADISIRVVTGPEVLTGSTRLKAGTATKMVLNMVTTIAMARTGKVYRNLMVDVNTGGNAKLVDRGVRMLEALTGRSRASCGGLLARAGGRVKTALVMHVRGVDRATAERLLSGRGTRVGDVLETKSNMVQGNR